MKRTNIKTSVIAILILLFTISTNAQDMSIGVALKGSTMGYGGDVVYQFHPKMTARLGYDQLKLSFPFNFEESGISYSANADIKTGSITALYDYYLIKYIFVSGGFALNNFNINATGQANSDLPWGDIAIPASKVGDFEFDIKPKMRVSPYLGIGFGRTLAQNNLVGFAFELGTYYQGSPDITIQTSGLIAPTSDPAKGQEAVLESQLSQYYLYPVIKFSLNFKIASF